MDIDVSSIYDSEKLIDINMKSIKWCMKQLNIEKEIVMASDLDVSGTKTELLVDICNQLKAEKYLSGPSGKDYLDMNLFGNIDVSFFEPKVENYYSALYNVSIRG